MSDGDGSSDRGDRSFVSHSNKTSSLGRCATILLGISAFVLALLGTLVVAAQTYIFVNHGEYISDTWFTACTILVLAAGCVMFLAGVLSLCCVSCNKTSPSYKFSLLMVVLSAFFSLASTVVDAIDAHKIGLPDGGHPCSPAVRNLSCDLWYQLDVVAAALSGLAFCLSLEMIIINSIGLGRRSAKSKVTENVVLSPVAHVMEPPAAAVADEENANKMTPRESVSGSQADRHNLSYIEELKLLSREELERRLEERLHAQFLIELRAEIERRRRVQAENEAQKRASIQPVPDYDDSVEVERIL